MSISDWIEIALYNILFFGTLVYIAKVFEKALEQKIREGAEDVGNDRKNGD